MAFWMVIVAVSLPEWLHCFFFLLFIEYYQLLCLSAIPNLFAFQMFCNSGVCKQRISSFKTKTKPQPRGAKLTSVRTLVISLPWTVASFSCCVQQLLCSVYIRVEGDLPIPGCNRNVIFPLTWADVLSAVLAITLPLPVVADVVSRLELKAKRGRVSAHAVQCRQHRRYLHSSFSTFTL